jgi:hypothetical protein
LETWWRPNLLDFAVFLHFSLCVWAILQCTKTGQGTVAYGV